MSARDDDGLNLRGIYEYRFRNFAQHRKDATWAVLAPWIERRMASPAVMLDPACGRGEFILASAAAERWAVDLVDQRPSWPVGVTHRVGDLRSVDLPTAHFDGIFVSNFLEHLETPREVYRYLVRFRELLRPGGRIAVMGPNFKYAANEYFDCADHLIALTHRSVEEHLASAGFEVETVVPRFVPFSFRSQRFSHPALVRAYLRLPPAWRILGKQFFLVARRPG
jgi:SAM-dependent methyltransferase